MALSLASFKAAQQQRRPLNIRIVRKPQPSQPRPRAPQQAPRGPMARYVSAPQARGALVKSRPGERVPGITTGTGKSIVIRHRERIGSVVTTGTALERRTYPVNPGLASTFPWLSSIAMRYQSFKFRSLKFSYVPQASAAAGSLTLAFDFNPNDPPPEDIDEACTFGDYATSSIWYPMSISPNLALGDRYPSKSVRAGSISGDHDLLNYDVGQLHVLTEGAAAGTIGFLEVTYAVELMVHQTAPGVGGLVSSTTGLDATHLVGTDPTPDNRAVLPVEADGTDKWVYTQPFEGIIAFNIQGTVLSADLALNPTGGYGTVISQVVNAGATGVVGYARVKGKRGDLITPTITATTVTSVSFRYAGALYNSLGADLP